MRKHWPQRTATYQMHMDVVDLLPAVTVAVHDEAITVLRNTFLLRDFRGGGKQTTKRLLVFRRDVIDGRYQYIRDD